MQVYKTVCLHVVNSYVHGVCVCVCCSLVIMYANVTQSTQPLHVE